MHIAFLTVGVKWYNTKYFNLVHHTLFYVWYVLGSSHYTLNITKSNCENFLVSLISPTWELFPGNKGRMAFQYGQVSKSFQRAKHIALWKLDA